MPQRKPPLEEFFDWVREDPAKRLPSKELQRAFERGEAYIIRNFQGRDIMRFIPQYPLHGPPLPRLANVKWPWRD